jgi:hypothetical protein
MTNLGSLTSAIPYGIASLHAAYQKQRGIEQMFRDYKKSGGYYLEGTGLKCQRLMVLFLLIAIAYGSAILARNNSENKRGKKVCYS